jgi:hypothetical protein
MMSVNRTHKGSKLPPANNDKPLSEWQSSPDATTDDRPPLPAALVRRGTRRLLCRARSQRARTRLRHGEAVGVSYSLNRARLRLVMFLLAGLAQELKQQPKGHDKAE